jgi:hypothetical protein
MASSSATPDPGSTSYQTQNSAMLSAQSPEDRFANLRGDDRTVSPLSDGGTYNSMTGIPPPSEPESLMSPAPPYAEVAVEEKIVYEGPEQTIWESPGPLTLLPDHFRSAKPPLPERSPFERYVGPGIWRAIVCRRWRIPSVLTTSWHAVSTDRATKRDRNTPQDWDKNPYPRQSERQTPTPRTCPSPLSRTIQQKHHRWLRTTRHQSPFRIYRMFRMAIRRTRAA